MSKSCLSRRARAHATHLLRRGRRRDAFRLVGNTLHERASKQAVVGRQAEPERQGRPRAGLEPLEDGRPTVVVDKRTPRTKRPSVGRALAEDAGIGRAPPRPRPDAELPDGRSDGNATLESDINDAVGKRFRH